MKIPNFLKNKYLLPATLCVVAFVGLAVYYLFAPLSNSEETQYIYIDDDDDADSVVVKLSAISKRQPLKGFTMLARHWGYGKTVHTGCYPITPGRGALLTFRRIKKGMQEPINLTIPSVRTVANLSSELSQRLMLDSAKIHHALSDSTICAQYGLDTATIICLFIPNTYNVYWDTSVDALLNRMKKEYDAFWNGERNSRAESIGMSPTQVMTLASIIDEETAVDAEKPMIAGMYYNRLMLRTGEYPEGMPLQADPTIKFALNDFQIRRIYYGQLLVDSPYNTYLHPGLPPGPIRIPSVQAIDAVLNHVEHDYLYMCAKEDFSGTHNFAATYREHLENARRYSKALNDRGIE